MHLSPPVLPIPPFSAGDTAMSELSSASRTAPQTEAESDRHAEEKLGEVGAPPDVPDGGWRACLVVFGSAITLFASFGVVSGGIVGVQCRPS